MENELKELFAEIMKNNEVKEELQKQLIDIKNQEFDNKKINNVIEALESFINNADAISGANTVSTQVTQVASLITGILERLDVVEQELGLYIDEDEVDLSNMSIEEMKEELKRLNDEFPDE